MDTTMDNHGGDCNWEARVREARVRVRVRVRLGFGSVWTLMSEIRIVFTLTLTSMTAHYNQPGYIGLQLATTLIGP